MEKYKAGKLLKFLIPSLAGIVLFITPVEVGGELTIPIAAGAKFLVAFVTPAVPYLAAVFLVLSVLAYPLAKLFRIERLLRSNYFRILFFPGSWWTVVRAVGLVFLIMVLFRIGPEWIWGKSTGGMVLGTLFPILISIFFLAGLLLPLLLNFGLLEFVGALLTKVMRPLFKLPGRSSVNCIASWLGDGTIGVLLTNKQYVDGYYTQREAAVISTTFTAVSITFCLVVIETVGLGNMFLPFYGTVTLAGMVAAVIMPRIPPLSRKKDVYYNNLPGKANELVPEGHTAFSWGLKLAVEKADDNKGVWVFLKEGFKNVFDMWIGVLPVVMAVGTVALIFAEYTPVFSFLGKPFLPLLRLLGVPEAALASQTVIVGFADMIIPSIIAAGTIASEITRFIIAALSVTQLIYMAEIGGLILGTKIPVSFWNLIVIFLERTIITLPVIVLMARLIFGWG